MKKILQRAGACICCCLVCFQLMIQPAHAVAVADDLLFGVLASLAVTSGVTFTAIETFDPVVTAIKNKMNENGITDEDIQGYISDGTRLVYDVGQYAWKAVVDVPDALWWGVQQAVSALYDSGLISLSQSTVETLTPVVGTAYTIPIADMPMIFSMDDTHDYRYIYDQSSGMLGFYQYSGGSGTLYFSSYNVGYLKVSFPTSISSPKVYWYTLGGTYLHTDILSSINSISYNKSGELGTISCSETVDDPDYDWSNEATQTKVVEFPSTYNGDPDDDSDDNKKLVYWPDIEKYLQGKDASDITSEDTSGIEDPAAQAQPDPSEAVTDYTEQPEAGSESNTSLKGLLFSKFPFCLPWDITAAFKLLAADPQAPYFEVDLVPQSIKVRCHIVQDTKWVIDMSDYEIIGLCSRWASTIGFCIALIMATRKLIHS